MNKRRLVAGALSASLLVSALPGLALAQDEEGPYAAEGVQWMLDTISGETVPDGVEVTLFLNDGEVAGNAGCNSYLGSYEIDAESLTFPSPFVVTRMACEGPAMDVEDAYLPLLQASAGWSVDDGGMLSLTDAEGAVALVYSEPPVEITSTDITALVATLEDLQAQIDTATAEVAALEEAAKSIDVNKLDKRLSANEEAIAANKKSISNHKKRLSTNEQAIADLNKQMSNVKKRVKALEATAKDHEARIAALEEPAPVPTQLPE